jgi:SAM-dependent methyltransferase
MKSHLYSENLTGSSVSRIREIARSLTCRSCGETDLKLVLSLGRMPLANALLTKEQLNQPEDTYPLDLVFCPRCTLVQITETVPPEKLFREYLYFSSFSDTVLHHSKELATRLIHSRHLDGGSLVVEVASNDGYLLQYYKQAGIPVLGIEPAVNIARVAREKQDIPTLCEFFGAKLARQLKDQGKQGDVIHAHNVLAHVADLNGFVEGIRILLKKEGVAIIEVPYVKDMIDRSEFDTIYHEHLCYFSLIALDRLFQRHGLVIQDVQRISIHGGSLRIFVVPAGGCLDLSHTGKRFVVDEHRWGLDQIEFYQDFASRVANLKTQLCNTVRDLKGNGNYLAAYGAAAKGTTLLNYFGIGQEALDFVVDRSTYKQDHYMPGVHLPIYSPGQLLEKMPNYVLVLAWNFADEIMSQQEEYRRRGGHFIIPIPELRIV